MSSRKLLLGSLLILSFAAVSAWAQAVPYVVPAASVDEQFSAYHEALNDAADHVLDTASGGHAVSSDQTVNPDRPNDELLRQFAQHYWGGQEQNVRRAVQRVVQLRTTLDPILHEEGVPVEVAALVLVESGGRPAALSPKGARGLWQFMPETARRYGLAVNPAKDERMDVEKSTRAAARFLRDLYSQFGDWKLAFAAYNAGEQAVQSARARKDVHDFENLRLPLETRNYVPTVFSAIELLGGNREIRTVQAPGRQSNGAHVLYASTEAGT